MDIEITCGNIDNFESFQFVPASVSFKEVQKTKEKILEIEILNEISKKLKQDNSLFRSSYPVHITHRWNKIKIAQNSLPIFQNINWSASKKFIDLFEVKQSLNPSNEFELEQNYFCLLKFHKCIDFNLNIGQELRPRLLGYLQSIQIYEFSEIPICVLKSIPRYYWDFIPLHINVPTLLDYKITSNFIQEKIISINEHLQKLSFVFSEEGLNEHFSFELEDVKSWKDSDGILNKRVNGLSIKFPTLTQAPPFFKIQKIKRLFDNNLVDNEEVKVRKQDHLFGRDTQLTYSYIEKIPRYTTYFKRNIVLQNNKEELLQTILRYFVDKV